LDWQTSLFGGSEEHLLIGADAIVEESQHLLFSPILGFFGSCFEAQRIQFGHLEFGSTGWAHDQLSQLRVLQIDRTPTFHTFDCHGTS
jgi:hypothetical protein